jgi:hypothetical protein
LPLILGVGVGGWAGMWAVNGARAGASASISSHPHGCAGVPFGCTGSGTVLPMPTACSLPWAGPTLGSGGRQSRGGLALSCGAARPEV